MENFDQLTQKQKAVLVAQDVIKWLDSKRMVAASMIYCDLPSVFPKGSLQESLDKVTDRKPCKVCGIGAMFIAAVDNFNKFDLKSDQQYVSDYEIRERLSDIFSKQQLRMIEHAFERWSFNSENEEHRAGALYLDEYDDDDVRLRLICQNIIDNRGEFVV